MARFIFLMLPSLLCGCGQSALLLKNDTRNKVEIDVIASSNLRAPFLRTLEPGLSYNSKVCAYKVDKIWLKYNGALKIIYPKDVCNLQECECKISISPLSGGIGVK